MENQHRKIKTYRELDQYEIDLINKVKAIQTQAFKLIDELGTMPEMNKRHLAIANTNIETGFMYVIKAIAKPSRV